MCDYSLLYVASRDARVGDRLVSTSFQNTVTRGFAVPGDLNTAVCLLPGTEVAFDREIEFEDALGSSIERNPAKVARFRQINTDRPRVHHDALELPDGTQVLLTRLVQGQLGTVLQLPAAPTTHEEAEQQKRIPIVA